MSDYNAPTIARTATPYADTTDSDGARRGAFSRVLWRTSRPWRRPSARRLAVGHNKGTAARWQRTIADGEAGRGVRLSFSLGTPEAQPPKNLYHTPHPRALGTPLVSRPPRRGTPDPKNMHVIFNSRIMEGDE